MASAYCPDCEKRIVFKIEPLIGQKLSCPHCEAELEVISTDPLELDWTCDWSDQDREEDY